MKRALVVTTTRAEYGLLKPLMEALVADPGFELRTAVSGTHLVPEFGMTVERILEDGFQVDERIDMLVAGDTPAAITKSLGLIVLGMADVLRRLAPDFVVLLGDRYELVGAAMATAVFGIPIVHLHGGEITEGAQDDAFRHAVSKLSHLHFTATEDYRRRVIQLGESPDRVHAVGAIGLDSVRNLELLGRDALARSLGMDLEEPYFLVTYHPVTAAESDAIGEIDRLMEALLAMPGHRAIVTHANADLGGRAINARLRDWTARHPGRIADFPSLGQLRYLSAMKHCAGVVGNSSSGLIEAPSFRVGTLDIGPRQKGRTRAASVLNVLPQTEAIAAGLRRLVDPAFRAGLATLANPYGDGRTVERIMAVLRAAELRRGASKVFHDLGISGIGEA